MLVRVLGSLEVVIEGQPVPLPPGKPRSVLAWLAIHPGQHERRRLARRLWPGVPETGAAASLRGALWALRSALGPAASLVLVTRERVGLAAEVRTDIDEAWRLARSGDGRAAAALQRARLLEGLDEEWVLALRERHRRELAGLVGVRPDGPRAAYPRRRE